ncbi:MAG: tetratricopeptide repeat protein, partial [Kiritimatiellae bacterium]|nr:tetratricopeptide repeat protein [Kiritimatiellia bacterium]
RYGWTYGEDQIGRIRARLSGTPGTDEPATPAAKTPPVAAAKTGTTVAKDVPDSVAAQPEPASDGSDDDDAVATPAPASAPKRQLAADLAEARAWLEAEQLDDAARLLTGLLRENPGSRPARLMIATVRVRQGRHDEALAALEDLRGTGEDLPLLLTLAGAYYGAGRYYDAMLALDQAVKLEPTHPHAYVNLAWLRLAMAPGTDGVQEAEVYYRQAVKLGARRDWQLERKLGLE